MTGEPQVVGHRFPRYVLMDGRLHKNEHGDYVHDIHAAALAERIAVARAALRQGRTGHAASILDEAYAYMTHNGHTR